MRQIDIHLNERDSETVIRAIKAFQPVDWMVVPLQQENRLLIRVTMHDGRSQALIDNIQDALSGSRDWRISMIPLEATVPTVEALEGDEARANLQVLREELLDDVMRDASLSRDFLVLSGLSTIVAAIGMNSDGVAAVIGAMVIAPLLGPILGFSLGAGLGNFSLLKEAGRTLVAGISIALLVALAASFFLPVNLESHELMSRAEVRLDGVALALAAGGAAALSMAQGRAAVLVGVMVAAALLPPGAALGLFLGGGYWEYAMRAGLLLLLNVACLVLSALMVFRLKQIKPRGWIDQRNADRATWINAGVAAGFLIIMIVLILVLDLEQAVALG